MRNTVTQVSTIDALLAGAYDGCLTLDALQDSGNFGIGTFDRLEGEMIVFDGRIYQARVDGTLATPPPSMTTPFAVVVSFEKDLSIALPRNCDYTAFKALLNRRIPNKNIFWAVKAHGCFAHMKVRSVPAQKKPYLPLADVVKDQAVFHIDNVSGTLIGFYSPAYVKGINVPGYHVHFISDSRKVGGHVLDFVCTEGSVDIDMCHRFLMLLPEGMHEFGTLDFGIDRSADLTTVERQ